MLRSKQLLILVLSLLVAGLPSRLIYAATAKSASTKASGKTVAAQSQTTTDLQTNPWSVGFNYGVSTDLADYSSPRLYYQGLGLNIGYTLNSKWSLLASLNGSFTTLDGQIDKRQEESALESTGVNPGFGLNFSPGVGTPWFLGASANVLLDTASRREGYLGLFSLNGGGTWMFFTDHFSMTHSFGVTELANTYDYSSAGTANPETWLVYSWSNALKLSEYFSLGTGFGLKQTRYLDGFWDYSYSTSLSASFTRKTWSMSLTSSNGGYTEDGRVSLWYVDRYRRLVSLSMAYQF